MPLDLSPPGWGWLALLALLAAFARGYAGFGFAALLIAGAALVADPVALVPAVLLCDLALTLPQARSIRGQVAWGRAGWLLAGAALGIPLGVWLFAHLSPDAGRMAVALWVLLMCAALRGGWRLAGTQGPASHAGVGAVSGIANGAAVGGLPVAAFFAAQALPPATMRATMIAYFAALDAGTLTVLWSRGAIGWGDLRLAALGLPLMVAGVLLGGRRFLATPPEDFRRLATLFLAALALLALLRAAL